MTIKSIAFIPDGNRRYAKKVGISLPEVYSKGIRKAWEVLKWLNKYPDITTATFYILSKPNMTRQKEEIDPLYKLFAEQIEEVFSNDFCKKNGIRIKFIGDIKSLPDNLQEKIAKVEDFTKENDKKLVNLAIAYDGRDEIIDAIKRIVKDGVDVDSLDSEKFKEYLYSNFEDPDLIVRTSGTKRMSGFLLYQGSYSEHYFADCLWPEFSEAEVDKIVKEFEEIKRNFGK